MDREAWTHALVSAAVVLEMDKDMCRSARVVLGGVAPIPWRLPEVERLLTGKRVTPAVAADAGAAAVAGAQHGERERSARSPARKNWRKKGGVRDGWVTRCLLPVQGEGRSSDRSLVGENQTRKAFLTGLSS